MTTKFKRGAVTIVEENSILTLMLGDDPKDPETEIMGVFHVEYANDVVAALKLATSERQKP